MKFILIVQIVYCLKIIMFTIFSTRAKLGYCTFGKLRSKAYKAMPQWFEACFKEKAYFSYLFPKSIIINIKRMFFQTSIMIVYYLKI